MKKRGRPRLRVPATEAQKAALKQGIKTEKDAIFRDRMHAVLIATGGTLRTVDIAARLGRATSAVQRWLDLFTQGGVEALRARQQAPGRQSAMQAPQVQKELAAGLQEGRWRTGVQMAAWLKQTHGITLSKTQRYYWLGKSNGAHGPNRSRFGPRPTHHRGTAPPKP